MKKFLFALFSVVALLATSCSKGFDDSEIWDKLNSLEERVAALEQLCKQMNTNITSLQTIVEALQKNDYVTNVAPIKEDGDVVGYTITFAKGDSITIYLSGNASTPQIGVKQHSDGIYYWTLGGELLLDDDGNKVKAQGNMPKLKIENEYWYVSYDNGATWSEVGEATSDDGDSMFTDVTYDDDYVYLTLSDGTALVLPRFSMPSNEIWYTSTDGNVITPYSSNVFGANIVSNVYEDGKGIITFDGDVTEIGYRAFCDKRYLASITIPDSVTSIGDYAFAGFSWSNELTSITIPNSVTYMGEGVFYNCAKLENVQLSKKLTSLDSYLFEHCYKLSNVTIPDSVTSLSKFAFIRSGITSITIPNSLTSLGENPFAECPNLQYFYGKYASQDGKCIIKDNKLISFAPFEMEEYVVPNGVVEIGANAFAMSESLNKVRISSSVTTIGYRAFSWCSALESVTIPDSVTSIGQLAFSECESLTSITLPEKISSIGSYAFIACTSLTTVFSKNATPPTFGYSMFEECNSLLKIYVPTSSVSAYKSASGWSSYASIIEGYNF